MSFSGRLLALGALLSAIGVGCSLKPPGGVAGAGPGARMDSGMDSGAGASAAATSATRSLGRTAAAKNEDWANSLREYGLRVAEPGAFQLKRDFVQASGDRKIRTLQLVRAGIEVELTLTGPLSREAIDNFMVLETTSFERVFAPTLTPYPGRISNRIVCPPRFQPRKSIEKLLGADAHVWSMKASPRRTFGVCADEAAAYDAELGLLELPSRFAVKARAFAPAAPASPGRTGLLRDVLSGVSPAGTRAP